MPTKRMRELILRPIVQSSGFFYVQGREKGKGERRYLGTSRGSRKIVLVDVSLVPANL